MNTEKTEPKKYKIETISDISELITRDNFESFFHDMINCYNAYIQIKEQHPETKFPFFTWIDDGKNDLKIELKPTDQ